MVDLLDAFNSQVQSHPHLPAVDHSGVTTTYQELGRLAGQIGASIRSATSRPGPRVLLAVPPAADAYAGMIGTLFAGGTICPINLDGPESRNADIARAFMPDAILCGPSPPSFLSELPMTIPRLDPSRPGAAMLNQPAAEYSEVAYVVFTSGSTGKPKGVKLGRTGFSQFLAIANTFFKLTPGERWGQFSNLGYDLAVMDVFQALVQGGTLVPIVGHLKPAAAIRDNRIAIWQSVPSALELMRRAGQISAEYLAPLRIMSFCGEPLLPQHLEALFAARPDVQVFNTYGTTETTGFNTINRLTADNFRQSCEAASVALGDDVPGWSLSLRGGNSTDEGEIVVSSDALSLGYWRDEDRTRDAFRQLRMNGQPEQRSYFTGDWGIRRNSRLYFCSRMDRQVKIRGERIELDEIDHALREAGFPAAYTILADDELYSFVEAADVDQELVRARLVKRLPFHAVPKTVRPIANFPRTNGKVDRKALERLVIS